MFTLGSLFTAMKNLAAEINRSTGLFRAANDQLEARLLLGPEGDQDLPALPAPVPENENGHTRRIARTRT
jgi:hypothetical protein